MKNSDKEAMLIVIFVLAAFGLLCFGFWHSNLRYDSLHKKEEIKL